MAAHRGLGFSRVLSVTGTSVFLARPSRPPRVGFTAVTLVSPCLMQTGPAFPPSFALLLPGRFSQQVQAGSEGRCAVAPGRRVFTSRQRMVAGGEGAAASSVCGLGPAPAPAVPHLFPPLLAAGRSGDSVRWEPYCCCGVWRVGCGVCVHAEETRIRLSPHARSC